MGFSSLTDDDLYITTREVATSDCCDSFGVRLCWSG